jgi:regulator of RNase E activity RraA
MSKRSGISFTRRTPDNITEELVAVLSSKASFEFKPLFEIMLLNLRERNAASGGEEMLRLRAYEKLQGLVSQGAVRREVTGATKKYKGVAARMAVLRTEMKALRAACNQRALARAAAAD